MLNNSNDSTPGAAAEEGAALAFLGIEIAGNDDEEN
jgi:hypothetical protein